MVFSATSLPVKVSRARYTVPVAPLPSSFWISYLPTCRLRSTLEPALSVTWIWRVSFAATVPETDETRTTPVDRAAGSGAGGRAARANRAAEVAASDARLDTATTEYGGSRCYVARPRSGAVRLPTVIVLHDERGLGARMEDMARRAPVAGFAAIAPELSTAPRDEP